MKRLMRVGVLAAVALAGCAGLNPRQEQGWVAFHDCQPGAPSAILENLLQDGRVDYQSVEGIEFSSMKACMERRGYACDLGLMIGSRPRTSCIPKAG